MITKIDNKYIDIEAKIVTDNEPNFAYINSQRKNLGIVRKAYANNPSDVKFYKGFVKVNDTFYNGISREMITERV